ncbi:MAG: ISL3 family transposase [Acidobacteria bacterium]|nr:ISL3 family transposase [Acidobacteriota bacterium]
MQEVESGHETDEVDIYVEYVGQAKVYDHAPPRRWRHLDIMQYKTFINASLPRVKTSEGKVKTLFPPWADKNERHSYLFEIAVIEMLQATMNQTQTRKLMRCSFDVVNRILHKATERGMERRKDEKGTITRVGIDEKSFRKGHRYASILSDTEGGRILEVEEHRTKKAAGALLEKGLTDEQRREVEEISMDMWEWFRVAAEEKIPEAEIVHDKFHLIKYLNEAIDKVRRREVKEHEELKESRYALLKNEENLTEKQKIKFEEIRAANFEVSRAWEARENFKEIFKNKSREESEAIFEEWHRAVKKSGIAEVIKVAEMFANHLRGVLNAMTSQVSNAMAERLNGKIQLLKAIGRGYRKFVNFRSAILFFYGKLDLFPLNSQ